MTSESRASITRASEWAQRLAALTLRLHEALTDAEPERILQLICQQTLETLGFEQAAIFARQTAGQRFQRIAAAPDQPLAENYSPAESPLMSEVAHSGEPILIPDVEKWQGSVRAKLLAQGMRSILLVPMKARGRLIGILVGTSRQAHHLAESDLPLAQILAAQGALALQNTRLYSAILHEQARWRQVAENLPLGLLLLDGDANIVYANHRSGIASILQDGPRSYREILAKSEAHHLDGRPAAFEELPSYRALQGETVMREQFTAVRPDSGKQAILEISAAPIAAGEPGAVVVYSDITEEVRQARELREAQNRLDAESKRFKAIFEAINDAALVTDGELRIVDYNPAMCRLLAVSRQELVGQSYISLIERFNLTDTAGVLIQAGGTVPELALASGSPQTAERLITRLDGQERQVVLTSSPLLDPAGQSFGTVSVWRDLTEQANLEQARDRFITLAVHELRNPLTAAVGAAEMMTYLHHRGRLAGERLDRYIPILNNQLSRLSIRVENLYETYRMQLNPMQLAREPLDLREVVDAGIKGFQSGRMDIDIQSALPDQSVIGSFDRKRMTQAVENLLDYAFKYSPESSPIHISLTQDEYPTPQALIEVRDEGIHVAAEDLPHLFERFYRPDQRPAGTQRGAGIGLYIVRVVAQGHGGEVWATNMPGEEGVTIHMRLPIPAVTPD